MTRTPAEQAVAALEALRPFADAVYNDNGDVSIDTSRIGTTEYMRARRVYKTLAALTAEAGGATTEKGGDGNTNLAAARNARDKSAPALGSDPERAKPCTCHPDDWPPVPCPQRYALSECRKAAAERVAPVPPDREALGRRLEELASGLGTDYHQDYIRERGAMLEAAALLRAPAQAEVEAWAVIDENGINVKTIHTTRRGAIVNWLVVTKWWVALHDTTDEAIEEAWQANKQSAEAERVYVSRLSLSPAVGAGWRPIATAPKDGTHILVCRGKFNQHWTFAQAPPAVVHWWSEPGEEGYYLSTGGTPDEMPYPADRWQPLPLPPAPEEAK